MTHLHDGKKETEFDFAAAEHFLKAARDAYECGDDTRCLAARKLVGVALHLVEIPNPMLPAR